MQKRLLLLQVALLSGLDAEGLKKLSSPRDGDHHLNKLLRVLTVRIESGKDRSGIALVGGPHDPKVDGAATQRYWPLVTCDLADALCHFILQVLAT